MQKELLDQLETPCIVIDMARTEENVIRHYDVTGKICPKYFVDHEDAWELFKGDVKAALEKSHKE